MNATSWSDEAESIRPSVAWIVAAIVLITILVAGLPVLGAVLRGENVAAPWTRPFLLDEFHTLLLVKEPSITSLLSKLSRGGDYNPPALFVLLRPWTSLWGVSEGSLRAFSTVAMIIGLVGVYVALRRGVSQVAALAATTLLFTGIPILQIEAMNARFYALWFAETAWLVALLGSRSSDPLGSSRGILTRSLSIATLSALMCLTHYFGVFAIAGIACGQFLVERITQESWKRSIGHLALLSVGPLCVIACLPMFLGQRAALEVPTWIAPSGRAAIDQLINPFFRSITLTTAALMFVVSVIWNCLRLQRTEQQTITLRFGAIQSLGASWGLMAVPFFMLAFHFLVQPISVARYAVPTAVGVAGFTAIILAGCDRRILVVVVGATCVLPVIANRLGGGSHDHRTNETLAQIAQLTSEDVPRSELYVYKWRGVGYQAWRYSKLPAESFRLLYPHGDEPVSNFDRLERSVAVRMHELFGTPATTHTQELLAGPPFVLFAEESQPVIEQQFVGAEVTTLITGEVFNAYRVKPSSTEMAPALSPKPSLTGR